jgi:hypothetical protein
VIRGVFSMSFRASDDEFAECHGCSLRLGQTNCYVHLSLLISIPLVFDIISKA